MRHHASLTRLALVTAVLLSRPALASNITKGASAPLAPTTPVAYSSATLTGVAPPNRATGVAITKEFSVVSTCSAACGATLPAPTNPALVSKRYTISNTTAQTLSVFANATTVSINGKTTLSAADGVTSAAATKTLTSASATFGASGVLVGDTVVIAAGADAGTYQVTAVANTVLTVGTNWATGGQSSVSYSIVRPVLIPAGCTRIFTPTSTTAWRAAASTCTGGITTDGPVVAGWETVVATGTNQATAAPVTTDRVYITSSASGTGIILPSATAGRTVMVSNNGSATVNIYPASGETTSNYSANQAFPLGAGGYMAVLRCTTAGSWALDLPMLGNAGATHYARVSSQQTLYVAAGITNAGDANQNTNSVSAAVAAAGATSQANATALTRVFNVVTTGTVATADGVKLAAAAAGIRQRVKNRTGITISVFPASGDKICNELVTTCPAADVAITLADGASVDCFAEDATTWNCK